MMSSSSWNMLVATLAALLASNWLFCAADDAIPQRPIIKGNWKRITSMPELGELAGAKPKKQHIVDHGLIQDAVGNWRVWAGLRGVSVGRFLYGWKIPELFAESWKPLGIAARAEERFGD